MKESAMPAETTSVMGLFRDEDRAAAAIKEMDDWHLERVHSPIPSHKLAEALNPKKSRVGWFTLAGGILGFFTGFGLASFFGGLKVEEIE